MVQKYLDWWYRWGKANHRGKIVSCGFACEPLLVLYLTIVANMVSRLCTSRSPYQLACLDPYCYTCLPGYLDCTCLLKMHCAGSIGYELILQLPSALRADILSSGNGVFYSSDVDWPSFHRDGVKEGKHCMSHESDCILKNF